VSKNYQGEFFEGNYCRRLLKEADSLFDKEVLGNISKLEIVPFVESIKSMNRLVHKCFKSENVSPGWQKDVEDLKKNYKATGLSITLKAHVLMEHLDHCLHYLGGMGLGRFSEQAGESVHREFLKFWEKYKINDINDPKYAENLKKAVTTFCSFHL
jgi:hypothetical protein